MYFFRADKEYTSGPLDAESIERSHDLMSLRTHVMRSGVGRGDSYISLTEDIGTATLKYSYGHTKNRSGKFRYNKIRSKILLIDFDDEMLEGIDVSDGNPPQEDSCYTRDRILLKLPELSNFMVADKEAVVYRRISEKRIFEVHPLLADILMQLEVSHNIKSNDVYNRIIEGIKSGKYSVQKINDFISTLEINDVEKKFINAYYIDRKNIVDTYDSVFPYLSNSKEIKNKMFDANCLRAQVLKSVFSQFVEREFKDIKPDLISDAYIPMEEDITMSAKANMSVRYSVCNNIYIGKFENKKAKKGDSFEEDKPKKVSYGLKYIYGDDGSIIGYITLYKEVGKILRNDYGIGNGQIRMSIDVYEDSDNIFIKLNRNSNYVGDNLKNSSAVEPREKYINSEEGKKYIRQSHDNPKEYFAFDEDGSCLKCCMDERRHLKIVDFVYDKQGNISKYDPRGYDKDGFDRIGTNEAGLPSSITLSNIRDLSEEEIKEKLRTAIHHFENLSKEGLDYNEPPLQRLLSTLFDVTSNSTMDQEGIKDKAEIVMDSPEEQKRSRDAFYRNIMKKFFDKENNGTEAYKRTQELCDKLIRCIISVARENDIDIKEFMESEMQKKIEENNKTAEEARKILEMMEKKLEKMKETEEKKEKIEEAERQLEEIRADLKGTISGLDNTKIKIAVDRFKSKYTDKRGDGRGE